MDPLRGQRTLSGESTHAGSRPPDQSNPPPDQSKDGSLFYPFSCEEATTAGPKVESAGVGVFMGSRVVACRSGHVSRAERVKDTAPELLLLLLFRSSVDLRLRLGLFGWGLLPELESRVRSSGQRGGWGLGLPARRRRAVWISSVLIIYRS